MVGARQNQPFGGAKQTPRHLPYIHIQHTHIHIHPKKLHFYLRHQRAEPTGGRAHVGIGVADTAVGGADGVAEHVLVAGKEVVGDEAGRAVFGVVFCCFRGGGVGWIESVGDFSFFLFCFILFYFILRNVARTTTATMIMNGKMSTYTLTYSSTEGESSSSSAAAAAVPPSTITSPMAAKASWPLID